MKARSDNHQNALAQQGYQLINCLDAQDIEDLLELYASVSHASSGIGFSVSIMSHDLDYRKYLNQQVKSILHPKIHDHFPLFRLCFCSFIVKQPHLATSEVQMHQDWSFVDETQAASYGIWCPLTDVDAENGCLSVIPGSHTLNQKPRGLLNDFPYIHLLPTLEAQYLVQIPMQAGQALIYDSRLFHCSPMNQSPSDRIVAAGLMVPQGIGLRYYHRDLHDPNADLEVFEVDDDFYTRLMIGTRPTELTAIGWVENSYDLISLDRLVKNSHPPA